MKVDESKGESPQDGKITEGAEERCSEDKSTEASSGIMKSYSEVTFQKIESIVKEDEEDVNLSKKAMTLCKNTSHQDKTRLPKRATNILKAWFLNNIENPYPTTEMKEKLCQETGLNKKQIQNWFTNSRKVIIRNHLTDLSIILEMFRAFEKEARLSKQYCSWKRVCRLARQYRG